MALIFRDAMFGTTFLVLILLECHISFSLPSVILAPIVFSHGLNMVCVGLFMAAFALFFAVGIVVMGFWLPKLGLRFALVTSTLLAGTTNCLIGLMPFLSDNRFIFGSLSLLMRCMAGFSAGQVTGAVIAFLPLFYSTATMENMLSTMAFSTALGLAGGPFLGSSFTTVVFFGVPFFVLGAAFFLQSFCLYFLMGDRDIVCPNINLILRLTCPSPAVLVTCLHVVVFTAPMGFIETVLAPYLANRFDITAPQSGLLFLAALPIIPFSFFITGCLMAGFLLWIGFLLLPLAMFCFGPSFDNFNPDVPPAFYIGTALFILGCSFGIGTPAAIEVLAKEVERTLRSSDERISTNSGAGFLFSTAVAIGLSIGSFAGGIGAQQDTVQVMTIWGYFISSYAGLLGIYLIAWNWWQNRRRVFTASSRILSRGRIQNRNARSADEQTPLLA